MHPQTHFGSSPLDTGDLPWIPLQPGESFKPIRFLATNQGRILLLRLEPGAVVARHRHSGEVHAFNLSGHRKLLETGEVIGPGGYVYEPPGNVDSWMAVGAEPVVVHIAAFGRMDFLDARGEVLQQDTGATLQEIYLRFCAERGLEPVLRPCV